MSGNCAVSLVPKIEAISGSTNRSSDRQNDNSTAELIRLHGSDTCTEGIVFTESHYWTDTATASADAAVAVPCLVVVKC